MGNFDSRKSCQISNLASTPLLVSSTKTISSAKELSTTIGKKKNYKSKCVISNWLMYSCAN